MKTVARGALLLSMLPMSGAGVSAHVLAAQLRLRGIDLHVRSIQRDLESMPPELVERRATSKPYRWWRVSQLGRQAQAYRRRLEAG
jgi:hypothetical protein